MSFKDVLNGKRRTAAAIFHKFRVDASIHTRRHVFVEGYEDIGFYSRHVEPVGASEVKFHLCFGKKNLDEVAVLYWQSAIKGALALFIRDSDFDVFLSRAPTGRDLFLTCGYAVENYVCSAQAVDAYLRTVFCLDEGELDLNKIVGDYVSIAQAFHEWLSPIYGAAMYALADGRAVDLNKLKVDEHFSFLLAGQPLPEPSTLPELSSVGLDASDFNEFSRKRGEEFSILPALLWMRGKFLLTILTSYLKKKEEEFRALHKAGLLSQFNRKAAANLNEPSLFDRLSGLANPTPRLASGLQAKAG